MKKKIYIISIVIIIVTATISGIVFDISKKSNDFKEAEREIEFLEDILVRESMNYGDEEILQDMLTKYSDVLNANILVHYRNGQNLEINLKNEEVIHTSYIDIDNEILKGIDINLYEEKFPNNYIKNLVSAMIISVIIALFFINRFIQDDGRFIEKLDLAIKKIIEGKYSNLELDRAEDEYLKLENDFNDMIKKIRENEDKYRTLNTRLKSIISSMNEGILAIDLEGNIILTNEFADYILGSKNAETIEGIKNSILLKGLDSNSSNVTKVVSLSSPIYKKIKVSISPIKYYKYSNRRLGSLYIFEDVTQVDKLERVRRDFIANVSHELKTPLTSIVGYVETLKYSNFEDEIFVSKALDIIDNEVIKMNNLLEDLLMLSEIENYNVRIEKGQVNINNMIDDIFLLFKDEALKKNIRLEKNILDKNFFVYSDEKYIRQILINLISNSIKYNRDFGFVCVTITRENSSMFIDVLDNGIGIKTDDQTRVFERFYRVDKSRSNHIKGTGLGLSIVKHIVSLLNGELFIESSYNKGTLVTVRLASI